MLQQRTLTKLGDKQVLTKRHWTLRLAETIGRPFDLGLSVMCTKPGQQFGVPTVWSVESSRLIERLYGIADIELVPYRINGAVHPVVQLSKTLKVSFTERLGLEQ